MTRRLPENLAILHAAFGEEAIAAIHTGDVVELDGVELVCSYEPDSTPERFYIVKSRAFVDRYLALAEELRGTDATIVELGIAEGGSTVLLALAARPRRLVAVDLESQRLDALDELLRRRGLEDSVRPRYGIDQSDRDVLLRVVQEETDGRPLDVVFDDCSHQLQPTTASFETLFPLLRPGGRYLIEDWNADQVLRDTVVAVVRDPSDPRHEDTRAALSRSLATQGSEPRPPIEPLSRLAVDLVLARSTVTDAIESVTVDADWISVVRGPAELDPRTFRVGDLFEDHFHLRGW